MILATLLLFPVGMAPTAWAKKNRDRIPVGIYVNFDEMAPLWPHRSGENDQFPVEGEEGFEDYQKTWNNLFERVMAEITLRVPRRYQLMPITEVNPPYPVNLRIWIGDVATSCDAPTYHSYLWVRTKPEVTGFRTNWDGLGVSSETLVDVTHSPKRRLQEALDSWVETWSQVPFLQIREIEGEVSSGGALEPAAIDPLEPLPIDPLEPLPIDPLEPLPIDPLEPLPIDPLEPVEPTPPPKPPGQLDPAGSITPPEASKEGI
ncbi:MAG: hypothetical protein ACE5FN_03705 [Leptospirillia bacterium]